MIKAEVAFLVLAVKQYSCLDLSRFIATLDGLLPGASNEWTERQGRRSPKLP